jgi:hypothetical protein
MEDELADFPHDLRNDNLSEEPKQAQDAKPKPKATNQQSVELIDTSSARSQVTPGTIVYVTHTDVSVL